MRISQVLKLVVDPLHGCFVHVIIYNKQVKTYGNLFQEKTNKEL